jgi:hypothetical protein
MELLSKQQIIDFIEKLPDDLPPEQITYRLYFEQRLFKAREQIKSGQFYSNEEAKDQMNKWLI